MWLTIYFRLIYPVHNTIRLDLDNGTRNLTFTLIHCPPGVYGFHFKYVILNKSDNFTEHFQCHRLQVNGTESYWGSGIIALHKGLVPSEKNLHMGQYWSRSLSPYGVTLQNELKCRHKCYNWSHIDSDYVSSQNTIDETHIVKAIM